MGAYPVRRTKTYLIGLFLSLIIIFMAHYSISILHGSYLAIDHMPAGGIFVFFMLVIFINPVLGLIKRSYELNAVELLIIYTMTLVTSSITTMGLGAQLMPTIAAPLYYATPENRWAELVHPHLRSWLHPRGEDTVRHFFEGLPPGASIPWMAWVQPVLTWFILIFSLYMVMTFLMVILRKQWVEQEKLTYPLVQLPVEMVRGDEKQSLIKPLFRNKLFWLAFAIPMVISSINSLNSYFPHFPYLSNTLGSIPMFRRTVGLGFRISFPVVGFAYLINQEVALGVWFFNFIYVVVRGIFNTVGISSTENLSRYGIGSCPILKNFGTGAFFTFVSVGFWMARSHLKDVFGKAFGRREADDSAEIVSYRTAVFGLIFSTAVMFVFLLMTGMAPHVAFLFIFFALIMLVGITRVVAETGIPNLRGPTIGSDQVLSILGSRSIGPEGLTALGLTYSYHGDLRTFPMVAIAQGLKMGSLVKQRRKDGMFGAVILSIFVTYFVSNWLVLRLAYAYGGINLNSWFFIQAPSRPFEFMSSHIIHPMDASPSGWAARISGAALMGLLMFVRYRFLWWPFHPFGFAVGSMMGGIWFSVFIAWLAKALMLKYGGVRMYRQGRSFALGLILGQYSAAGLWFVIDFITGNSGNVVFHT